MAEKSIEKLNQAAFLLWFFNHYILLDVSFTGHWLINNNISIPKKVINLYISYILNPWLRVLKTDFTMSNWLFGYVKLSKSADLDQRKYSGYGIGFDSCSVFSFTHGVVGKNVNIFGSLTLTVGASYHISFTQSSKRFVLSLHDNGRNSFLSVNATNMYQLKAKYSEIKDYRLC